MKSMAIFLMVVLTTCLLGCSSDENTMAPGPAPEANVPDADASSVHNEVESSPSVEGEAMTLRYRFEEGQRMDYLLIQEVATDIVTLNQQTQTNIDIYFHLTVDAVEADGTATLTQANDRVKFKVKGPGGTIVYDSADGEESDHPQWQGGLRVVIMAIPHAQCTFRVTPDGIVSDVKPTDELAARLKEDPSLAAVLTEVQLKANAKSVFHPMPGRPLKPGETWKFEDESDDLLPGVKMRYVVTKTYEGSEEREGRQVVRIGKTEDITTEFDQNSPIKYVVDNEASSSLEYYDLARGWKIESHDTHVATVTQLLGNNTIEAETSTKAAIYLQPAAEVEPVSESNSK